MNKNKVFFIIAICAFALVAAAPWILGTVLPGSGAAEAQTGEIRELAAFPADYSNDYFSRINSYVNDHSPMRTSIIRLVNSMENDTREWYSRNIMQPYVERMTRIDGSPSPSQGTLLPGQDTPEPTATPDWGGLFGDDPTETPEGTQGSSKTHSPAATVSGTAHGTEPGPAHGTSSTPHTHVYGEPVTVVPATCTNTGISKEKCSICGESRTVVTEALGHDYTVVRTRKASFDHDGYTLKKCSRCGDTQVTDVVMRTNVPGFYTDRPALMYSGSGFKGSHGWYFYAGDESVSYVQGDNVLSGEDMASWNETFTELKAQCDRRGIDLVILVCPNKEQVYQEYLPLGIDLSRSDEEKRASVFAEYMKNNSSVKYVYPLREIKAAKILYETYYQQDTHWSGVGGFVAAMQVYRALGMPTTGIQNVEVTEYVHTGGDLVSLGVGPALEYTGYSVDYRPEITVKDLFRYSNAVTGGNESPNNELKVMVSDSPNKHKALIIGDSFRHAVGGFIAKDYAKVTQAHRGDFDTYSNYVLDVESGVESPSGEQVIQNALRELGSDDLLLIMAVERYDFSNEQIAWMIAQFMKNM